MGWMTQDVNSSGAIGDPRYASAEKGEEAIDFAAKRLARLLSEVSAFPLTALKAAP